MDQNRSVSATFSINQYSLQVFPGDGGQVTGDGNFSHGTLAPISAYPNIGYSFAGWSGDGISDPSSLSTSIEMNESKIISSLFTINQYKLSIDSSSGGSVIGEGNYSHGQNATIIAVPNEGFEFQNWSGDIEEDYNSPSISLTMETNRSISAVFIPIENDNLVLTILSNPQDGGSTSGAGSFSPETLVNIAAQPSEGYKFSSWEGAAFPDPNSSSTVVNINADLTLTANFEKKSYFLEMNESLGGQVYGSGEYLYGSDVNITALAAEGYNFAGWIGSGLENPSSPSTSVKMTKHRSLRANFVIQNFDLSIANEDGGSVQSGSYDYGSIVSISAIPLAGYSFAGWTGANFADSSKPSTTVSVTKDTIITANFERIIYSLTVLWHRWQCIRRREILLWIQCLLVCSSK